MKRLALFMPLVALSIASCNSTGTQPAKSSSNYISDAGYYAGSYSDYEELGQIGLPQDQVDFMRYGNSDPSNKFYKLAKEMGGKAEADKFIEGLPENLRSQTLDKYGINYMLLDEKISSQALQDEQCLKYYPENYHDNYWNVVTPQGKTMRIYIDGYGRPNSSKMSFPYITTGSRDTTCQGQVGSWAEQAGYAGGHMVPDSFGGWGKRFNMYPQEAYFNNTAWKTVEAAARRCITKNLPVDYIVDLNYGWFNGRLTPRSVVANVVWRNRNQVVFVSMPNEPAGGATGDAAAINFRNNLISEGC